MQKTPFNLYTINRLSVEAQPEYGECDMQKKPKPGGVEYAEIMQPRHKHTYAT